MIAFQAEFSGKNSCISCFGGNILSGKKNDGNKPQKFKAYNLD